MPTIAEQLTQLESDRQDLVSNLQTKGITGLTGNETFTALVPEVLNIQGGGSDANFVDLVERDITTVSNSNITNVGTYAFYRCTSLTSVSLPNATSVGAYAFNGCTSLTSVSMSNATSIGNYAFSGCTSLTSVSIPNVTSILNNAFSGCTSLTSVDLPNATSISDSIFNGCILLTNANLQSATGIGYYAFNGCTSLTSVTLGANQVCSLLNVNAFDNISNTITIYVPNDLITSYQQATNWSTLYNNNKITFSAI